jgi:hypothetical protein
MTVPEFNFPATALVFAALSTSVIMVYLLIIININPQNLLRNAYVATCKTQLNPRKIVPESGNGPTVYIDVVSDQIWQAYLACVEAMPDKITPSISEAIDVWRGLSNVVMSLPSGKDHHSIDLTQLLPTHFYHCVWSSIAEGFLFSSNHINRLWLNLVSWRCVWAGTLCVCGLRLGTLFQDRLLAGSSLLTFLAFHGPASSA